MNSARLNLDRATDDYEKLQLIIDECSRHLGTELPKKQGWKARQDKCVLIIAL